MRESVIVTDETTHERVISGKFTEEDLKAVLGETVAGIAGFEIDPEKTVVSLDIGSGGFGTPDYWFEVKVVLTTDLGV